VDQIISNLNINNNKKKAFYALCYATFALTLDSISTIHFKWGINWGIFHWQLKNGFEVSTFILWFAIPFIFTFRSIDWKYFGASRLKKKYCVTVFCAFHDRVISGNFYSV